MELPWPIMVPDLEPTFGQHLRARDLSEAIWP